MSSIPRKPAGRTAEARFDQITHEILYGGPRKLVSGPSVRLEQTTRGIRAQSRRQKARTLLKRHPFEIYQLPSQFWADVGPTEDGWKTIRIRDGVMFNRGVLSDYFTDESLIIVDKTDGLGPEGDGDGVSVDTFFELEDSGQFYVFAVRTESGAAEIQVIAAGDITSGTFAFSCPYVYLLGIVEPNSGTKMLAIAQYQFGNIHIESGTKFYGTWQASAAGDMFNELGYPKGAMVTKIDEDDTQGIEFNWDGTGDVTVNSVSTYVSQKDFNTDDPYDHNETADENTVSSKYHPSWRRIGQFRKLGTYEDQAPPESTTP